MFMLQNFSGAVVINYYSPTLFGEQCRAKNKTKPRNPPPSELTPGGIGVSSADIFLYTGYYGLLKAFGAITFCFFIVDRAGRRNPWMLSAGACAVLLVYIAIFVKVAEPAKGLTSPSQIAGGKAAVAAIMLYSWFWSWGGCSLAWIVGAELFSIEMRSLTGAIGAATQWLSSFQATMSAPHMFDAIGWATFLYYGIFCFITLLFTFFWIPDTKGVSILPAHMDWMLTNRCHSNAWARSSTAPPATCSSARRQCTLPTVSRRPRPQTRTMCRSTTRRTRGLSQRCNIEMG
jgi:hypothetical protein